MNGDMEWTPPTESELKVIQARRERSDKISKLMGSYLLKGYKMLNETCPRCTTIYLRDKQNQLFCVACAEVDADTEKDNPGSSAEAARRQVAESQFSSSPPPAPAGASAAPPITTSRPRAAPPIQTSRVLSSEPTGSVAAASSSAGLVGSPIVSDNGATVGEIDYAAINVRRKLVWASDQLELCSSVEGSEQLLLLIRNCLATLQALGRHD